MVCNHVTEVPDYVQSEGISIILPWLSKWLETNRGVTREGGSHHLYEHFENGTT